MTGGQLPRPAQSGGSPTYYGFDRWGRVIHLRHVNYAGTTAGSSTAAKAVWFKYGYDRNSNRTFARSEHNLGRSRFHAYDRLDRLTSDQTGILDSSNAGLTSEWNKPVENAWTLDKLGNWNTLNAKHSGTSASETRGHNATNEIVDRTVTQQAPLEWANDAFASDYNGWDRADTGTWSINGGKLQNDSPDSTYSGAPNSAAGAVLLLPGQYQDVKLTVNVTLSSNAYHGGLVFGFQDAGNFWVLLASKATGKAVLYQVSGGTWTQRSASLGSPISGAGTYAVECEVRGGSVTFIKPSGPPDYDGTVPAGRIGLWSGGGTGAGDVKFDGFVARSLAANCAVDGRFFDDSGNVRVSGGKLEFYNGDGTTRRSILRHVRMSKGVVQADYTYQTGIDAGIILHYQDPENFGVALLDDIGASVVVRYVEFVDGKKQAAWTKSAA